MIDLNLLGKVTNGGAKRSEASRQISPIFILDAKLRFALLASLRSAIFAKFKSTTNWPLYPQGLNS